MPAPVVSRQDPGVEHQAQLAAHREEVAAGDAAEGLRLRIGQDAVLAQPRDRSDGLGAHFGGVLRGL
jgi:hypothetical protein